MSAPSTLENGRNINADQGRTYADEKAAPVFDAQTENILPEGTIDHVYLAKAQVSANSPSKRLTELTVRDRLSTMPCRKSAWENINGISSVSPGSDG